jgi:type I restriction enzyme M protein
MKTPADALAARYRLAHNEMRNIDGFQPSEALDELLKYLLYRSYSNKLYEPAPYIDIFSDSQHIATVVDQIKTGFCKSVDEHGGFVNEVFRSKSFSMTDACLAKVHEVLCRVDFANLEIDVRSAAIRSFLGSEIRKGLGIFLTPDEVVSEISRFFEYCEDDVIVDPACGSGTFLMAALDQSHDHDLSISTIGIDKSPRMMLLCELNIGRVQSSVFSGFVADTLRYSEYNQSVKFGCADYVLTNPPFGVSLDSNSYDLSSFATACGRSRGSKKLSSELLFIERALDLLKPDGWLAIVLPKSAINTNSGEGARAALDPMGVIRAIVDLPPETFAATGTMTNTVVLFVQKFGTSVTPFDQVTPVYVRLENVGFDTTGRVRAGSQLPGLGKALRHAVFENQADHRIETLPLQSAGQSFSALPDLVKGRRSVSIGRQTVKLRELVEIAATGTTPPRASYADSGLFLVKVGNLTGSGINWIPRDRNFVNVGTTGRRYSKESMILREGDILLTSSAHSPKYIAKKIDVISSMPEWVGKAASYVGEVMLVRPNQSMIDPYVLASYLRLPQVADEIQRMIRGQTAHLRSDDLLNLEIDKGVIFGSQTIIELADLLREESKIAERLNEISWAQTMLSLNALNESSLDHLDA